MHRFHASIVAVLSALSFVLSPLGIAAAQEESDEQAEPAAEAEPAPDEDREELARQVFQTGRMYFERAEYARAAEAFREAYELSGRAALLVNVARSLEAMGRDAEAIAALEQAIEEDEALRTVAEPRLIRLRAQVRHAEEAAGAEAAGAEAAGAEAAGAEAEGADAEGEPGEDETLPAVEPDSGLGGLFWGGLASAGAGAALLAVSIGTGVASDGIYGDLQQSCPDDACPADRRDDIDHGRSLAIASTVTLAIGGAAAVAGTIMMLLDGMSDEPPDETAGSVEVTGGPGLVGVGLGARF